MEEVMNTPTLTCLPALEVPGNAYRNDKGQINPFHWDAYHMGMQFGKNVMIMMANHAGEPAQYMILVNMRTGERVKIDFPKEWQ